MTNRLIVGCMTGTSLDGLDVVLADISGHGMAARAKMSAIVSLDFPVELCKQLAALAAGEPAPPQRIAEAARALGELHARGAQEVMAKAGGRKPDLVCSHGQTIWHNPGRQGGGVSWQLFDPWPLVHTLGVPVVYDLRQADILAGGQGAPITPITDPMMYALPEGQAVNLGGIANVTQWDAKGIRGGDLGPCNLMLDALAQRLLNRPYDKDGEAARQCPPCSTRLPGVTGLIKLRQSQAHSLGREQFGKEFIDALLDGPLQGLPASEALATAVEAVAAMLEIHLKEGADVILAGGGARHALLVERLQHRCAGHGVTVSLSDEYGIPAEAREALSFALLGALCQDKVSIYVPEVTGAEKAVLAGAWAFPG